MQYNVNSPHNYPGKTLFFVNVPFILNGLRVYFNTATPLDCENSQFESQQCNANAISLHDLSIESLHNAAAISILHTKRSLNTIKLYIHTPSAIHRL